MSHVIGETVLINTYLRCILNLALSPHLGDQAAKHTEDKGSTINNKKISYPISSPIDATNHTDAAFVLLLKLQF